MSYWGTGQHGGNSSGGAYGPVGESYAHQGNHGGSPGLGGHDNAGAYGDLNSMMSGGKNAPGEAAFAAACCIVVGAVASGVSFISSFQFVDWLLMTYLLVFGLILAVVDTPILSNAMWVVSAKIYVGKYAQLVMRLSGKGTALVFLGSALSMSMWDNLTGGMWMFVAVVLSLIPIIVGLSFIAGRARSLKGHASS